MGIEGWPMPAHVYDWKFVCPRCSAIHYYRPLTGCQRCKHLILKKVRNRTMAEKEEVVKNGETQLRLEIDKFKLDEELVGQPMQVFLWARKTADAQLEFDEAKAELSLSYAELDKWIQIGRASCR